MELEEIYSPFDRQFVVTLFDDDGEELDRADLFDVRVSVLVNRVLMLQFKKQATEGWLGWTNGDQDNEILLTLTAAQTYGWRGLVELEVQQVKLNAAFVTGLEELPATKEVLWLAKKSAFVASTPNSANVVYNPDTVARTLHLWVSFAAAGLYQVEAYFNGGWNALIGFNAVAGSQHLTFAIDSDVPTGVLNIRVRDAVHNVIITAIDNVNFSVPWVDVYTWLAVPTITCSGGQQKLRFHLSYSHTPAATVYLYYWNGTAWIHLTDWNVTPSPGEVDYSGGLNVTIPAGTTRIRVLNLLTGTELIQNGVVVITC